MQGLENDLAFLEASVPELEKYLLSDTLYYPVTGEHGRQLSGDTTQLTLGNLLLSMIRLRAAQLPPEEKAQVGGLLQEVDGIRSCWHTNWRKKVEQEIPSRLRLWKNYVSDWSESSPGRAGDYHYNIRLRVMLDLLLDETDELFVQEKSLLRTLDLRLKGKGMPGDFIWDQQLAGAFPRDRFWYLYWHF